MRVILLGAALALAVGTTAGAAGSHAVRGYVTKNGTYVAPTRATNPNRTRIDNYSSKPNVNPYSGKSGTVDPFKPASPKK